ncbi:D-beta-hydroxybutyrate dehydrogenase-like [Saccoglossus kowalevskii]|uniref:3-oxoacyl-[acyl-carrier-protein] reductase n=1 Tax=Saccoglossus kowalevskii TaxID=10224 RepID=A0ABM0MKD2_SACKO|nr:PREDICTED: 3-oxoacyl-[acyl-carrier-protein] reductase, chloroplastic-like [Saccoglossus kowalevskii]
MSRYALVTGSTSGIGLAIARSLARNGCAILFNGFAEESHIAKLKHEFENKYDVRAHYLGADLTNEDDVLNMCEDIKKVTKSGVDILVNNAGFQYVSPVQEFSLDKWNDMIHIMLTTPFILTKHLLPGMLQKGWGRVINISSVHGLVASKEKSAYVSAKHGVLGLTKVVALETAGTGVTCNAICPGWVATELFWKQVKTIAENTGVSVEEATRKFAGEKQPSGQDVQKEHIGDVVNFLCSEAANQMTGSTVTMDGGWTAQ